MLKLKFILIASFIVISTFKVPDASAFSILLSEGAGAPLSYFLLYEEENEISLNSSEESEVPFQDAIYPELELMQEPDTYTVIKGDNLYQIARSHNISLEALMSLNDLSNDLIHPDDVLIVERDASEVKTATIELEKKVAVSVAKVPIPIVPPTPTVNSPPVNRGTEMIVTATAYTAYCKGCSGTTAYGFNLRANPSMKVIAVDPRVIPLGTRVWVEGYGEAIAGDTGGAIKGNKIDVFIPSYDLAMEWGIKKVKMIVLN